jgi:hypothetical protein
MNKIAEYKTAFGPLLADLDEGVNKLIKEGYQPYGSPYATRVLDSDVQDPRCICQAMVKYGVDQQR